MKWPFFLLKCSTDLLPFDRTIILTCDLENNIDCGIFAILSLVNELEVDEWYSLERKHMLATTNTEVLQQRDSHFRARFLLACLAL